MKCAATLGIVAIVAVGAGFAVGRWLPPAPRTVETFLAAKPAFLVDHPELIEFARPIAKLRREADMRMRRRATIQAAWQGYLGEAATPRLGRRSDPIVVVEFTDYACVPCKSSAERFAWLAASNPDTQFVLAFLPGGNSGAELAARAAIAVWKRDPGSFSGFHRELMAAPIAGLQAKVEGLMVPAEAGNDHLWQDIGSPGVLQQLRVARVLADDVGIRGVPSFVVDGQLLTGPVPSAELQRAIDDARAARTRR